MTEQVNTSDQQAIAYQIFALYYGSQWPLRRIADYVGGMSGETVRKILRGETWQDITEELRARFPAYVQRGSEPFDDATIAGVFGDYYDKELSLSEIARGLDVHYTHVRKILRGDAEYAEPTEELRAKYPPYAPRSGRGSRVDQVSPERLEEAFIRYYLDDASLDDAASAAGVSRTHLRGLLTGTINPETTVGLRAQYGDTIRPALRPAKVAVE